MAISSTFFLDSPSLSTATAVYSTIYLDSLAPDGFYSDGTIVREQALGVLLPQAVCPSCATPCGGTISASGNQGVYYLNTDLGSATGAVIVTFDPISVPDGILATFNSVTYNGLSSPIVGWLQGSSTGQPTYIGNSASACVPNLVSGSPYTLNVYNYSGGSFVASGGTEVVSIVSGQLDLIAGQPDQCVMVIPKTAASPSILELKFIGPCSGTAFNISVGCPAPLESFPSSYGNANASASCAEVEGQTYYVAHVNGFVGSLGLYDLVFQDPNGQFKLGAGYYKSAAVPGTDELFQVDANGVIIAFSNCP